MKKCRERFHFVFVGVGTKTQLVACKLRELIGKRKSATRESELSDNGLDMGIGTWGYEAPESKIGNQRPHSHPEDEKRGKLHFVTMNRLPKEEVIRELRAQLQHFDRSPDFGDGESVQVIRQLRVRRIHEAEGALLNRSYAQPRRGFSRNRLSIRRRLKMSTLEYRKPVSDQPHHNQLCRRCCRGLRLGRKRCRRLRI